MIYLFDMLQSVSEALTVIMVNKVERGNVFVLLPLALAACWFYQVRLHHRKQEWLSLSPEEQMRRQQLANTTNRRDEPYPL